MDRADCHHVEHEGGVGSLEVAAVNISFSCFVRASQKEILLQERSDNHEDE